MPKNPPQSGHGQQNLPQQILQRAALALQGRQFAAAEQLAADVLKASRTDLGAVQILARALMAQERGGEAIPHLQRAAKRSEDPGIETLLGAALAGAGRRADAVDLLRRTAARRPPFLPAFQELAGQLTKQGRIDEAIAVIEASLALAPDSIDLQLDLARLYLECNLRNKARAILSRLADAAPGRLDVLTALAYALRRDGEHGAAADICRRVLAQRPDDPMTRADLAACLLELGEREAGERNLRGASRGRPQMLGRVLYTLVHASHGRFFLKPSALAKFIQDQAG